MPFLHLRESAEQSCFLRFPVSNYSRTILRAFISKPRQRPRRDGRDLRLEVQRSLIVRVTRTVSSVFESAARSLVGFDFDSQMLHLALLGDDQAEFRDLFKLPQDRFDARREGRCCRG